MRARMLVVLLVVVGGCSGEAVDFDPAQLEKEWAAAVVNTVASDSPNFHPPVRLQAGGKFVDTGSEWGHSGPCLADVDGNGLRDLVVGSFGGKFHVFRNVGRQHEPEFESGTLLMAGGVEAEVPIYCCVGSSPQFVDFDADGHLDMISGSYDPGECYLFRGLGDGKYAARETIVDKDGKPIIRKPDQQQTHESFGSWPAMVDWDDDGDLDLLVGGFSGEILVRVNEGTRQEPQFGTENVSIEVGGLDADDVPIKDGHAAVVVADWDGDGRWDILSGSDTGAVYWLRNIGEAGRPSFAAAEALVPKHDGNGYDEWLEADAEPVPGIRSQIAVTDYNGDGKLDLLLGDFCTTITPKPDLSAAKRAKMLALQAEAETAGKTISDGMEQLRQSFLERYPGDAAYSDEADAAWSKEYQEFRASAAVKESQAKMDELDSQIQRYLVKPDVEGSFNKYATTRGYVWLYLRK